tara:strand:+ start:168 stop:515 length:348 start_codon:yes stop_codon:yes gene_type:complete
MIKEETITNDAPNKVFVVGISSQIKYPKIIPKTSARYFNGDTRETSENLNDWLSHKFANPPKNPIMHSRSKSFIPGIIHPNGIVNKLAKVISAEKFKEISHTGSVVDSCLIAIAT